MTFRATILIPSIGRVAFASCTAVLTIICFYIFRLQSSLPYKDSLDTLVILSAVYFLSLSYLYACRAKSIGWSIRWPLIILVINFAGAWLILLFLPYFLFYGLAIAAIGIFLIITNTLMLLNLSLKKRVNSSYA
jgi:hypothetical protein